MGPFRLVVKQRGKSYVADNGDLNITAVAQSASDAAENARRMALVALGQAARSAVLLVRIEEPGKSTIVMQPLDRPVSVIPSDADAGWRYIATVSQEAAVEKAT